MTTTEEHIVLTEEQIKLNDELELKIGNSLSTSINGVDVK